jgi:Domain of unknown function (DUF4131)
MLCAAVAYCLAWSRVRTCGGPSCAGWSPEPRFWRPRRTSPGDALRWGWSLALAAIFCAGALQVQAHGASTRLNTSIQPHADREELEIIAQVTRDGGLQRGGFHEIRQTIDVETEQVQTAGVQSAATHSGVRLSIYSPSPNHAAAEISASIPFVSETPMPVFHYGDHLRFVAELKLPRNFRNPGAFDYRGYFADRNIAALGSTKIENVERLPGLPAIESCSGAAVCTGTSQRRSRSSGLRAKPR